MAWRYKLSDEAWAVVSGLYIETRGCGRRRLSNRLMLDGVLWVLCSSTGRRDMPERCGPWSTVYQIFRGWRKLGTFDQVLKGFRLKLSEEGSIDLQTLMIDSTAVHATRASSGARKAERGDEHADHALCRSRSGMTAKSSCSASPTGHRCASTHAQPLLDELSIPSAQRGRLGRRCKWLFADKGYDAQAQAQAHARLVDRLKNLQRNIIERILGWLNENRRIVTRFHELAKNYAVMVSLACSASDEYSEVSHSSG